jgi:hypothetical protein
MTANFSASSQTVDVAHLGIPFDLIQDTQTITGDGAIQITSGAVLLTKASAGAITIAIPDQDGQTLWVIAGSAQAHVITQATDGFNAKGSSGTCTFTAALGNAVCLISLAGHWWATVKTGVTIA